MKKWLPNFRALSLFSMLVLLLSGCGQPFISTLQPAGEVADTQYSLMLLSTIIMVFVIIVVSLVFIFVVGRFRQKKGQESMIPEQVEGNHKLEVIWTVIPILLLLVLAIPTVSATFKLADVSPMEEETRNEDTLVVNVRANLYWWEFEYPDYGIVTSQDLIVPTDERVYFNLISSDVKHSFWIPSVGGKLDTNVENTNRFYLTFDSSRTPDAEGLFYGKCAELCGPSHALMDFKVKPVARAEFDQWIEGMQNYEPKATTDLATQGEEIFAASCISCHAVDPSNETPPQARLAPNLANFGDRSRIAGILEHNEENLKSWIRDPEQFKPGNKMTGTYNSDFSDAELDALTEYLMGLKLEQ